MLKRAVLLLCGVLATVPAAAQAPPATQFAAVARTILVDGETLPIDPAVGRLMGLPDGEQNLMARQVASFEPGVTRFLSVRQRPGTMHLDIVMMRADAATEDVVYCFTSESATLDKAVRIAGGVARLLPDEASQRAFDDELGFWLWRRRPLSA